MFECRSTIAAWSLGDAEQQRGFSDNAICYLLVSVVAGSSVTRASEWCDQNSQPITSAKTTTATFKTNTKISCIEL